MDATQDITGMLVAWRGGDQAAADRLFSAVYEDLRRIARRQLGRERAGHTLDTTAIVHEAYLRLVDQTRAGWVGRAQFFAVASRVMRRLLVDYARRHCAAKRGGAKARVSLSAIAVGDGALADERAETLLALDEALTGLLAHDERLARVVELRFFGGLTNAEVGEVLGVTERTVERDWVRAKQWLSRELGP